MVSYQFVGVMHALKQRRTSFESTAAFAEQVHFPTCLGKVDTRWFSKHSVETEYVKTFPSDTLSMLAVLSLCMFCCCHVPLPLPRKNEERVYEENEYVGNVIGDLLRPILCLPLTLGMCSWLILVEPVPLYDLRKMFACVLLIWVVCRSSRLQRHHPGMSMA